MPTKPHLLSGQLLTRETSSLLTGASNRLVLVTVTIVVRNTTPRLRTDQAVRFFWGPATVAALAAAGLAWGGW